MMLSSCCAEVWGEVSSLIRILRASAFLFLFALLAASPAHAAPKPAATTLTLEKLLAGFRGLQGLAAHFHEEKHMELLAAPLLSEGDLYFIAPERLSRRIT